MGYTQNKNIEDLWGGKNCFDITTKNKSKVHKSLTAA